MLLIGDGLLSLLDPKRHCLLWEVGPESCRELIDEFVEHPRMTRGVGFAELVLGVLLSSEQKPKLAERLLRT
jgi:hypothetical protein